MLFEQETEHKSNLVKQNRWPHLKFQPWPESLRLSQGVEGRLKINTELAPSFSLYKHQINQLMFTQYKKSHVRVVFVQRNLSWNFGVLSERNHCLSEITSANVVSAAGVPVNLRFSKISEKLTSQATRRVLLQLGAISFNLFLTSQTSCFASFWKSLNKATNEVYIDTTNQKWVFDVHVKSKFSLNDKLINNVLFSANNLQPEVTNQELQQQITNFKSTILSIEPKLTEYRLALNWEHVFIIPKQTHCKVKTKKARSIKKRLTKRLTTLAQRRHWIV